MLISKNEATSAWGREIYLVQQTGVLPREINFAVR